MKSKSIVAGELSIVVLLSFFVFQSCHTSGRHAEEDYQNQDALDTLDTLDTLVVGNTFWWPYSGPFIGMGGYEYSLVFTGRISEIGALVSDSTMIYSSRPGIIEIIEVLKVMELENEKYEGQEYFSSDCFYEA